MSKLSIRPEVCVGGIAIRGGDVLLIKRAKAPSKGKWTLPGGRVELGETLEQAVIREIREETNLQATVGPQVTVLEKIASNHSYHFIIIDFLVTVEGQMRAQSDAEDAAWFAVDELRKVSTTEGLVDVVLSAQAMGSGA